MGQTGLCKQCRPKSEATENKEMKLTWKNSDHENSENTFRTIRPVWPGNTQISLQISLRCSHEFFWPLGLSRSSSGVSQHGIHVTKWLGLLLLAPLQVSFFNIDLNLMEFFQIKARVSRKSSSLWWCQHYSVICSDSQEHWENVFHQNSCIVLLTQTDSNIILQMFSRMRSDHRIALTPSERASFSAYSALYFHNFHLIWIEIF